MKKLIFARIVIGIWFGIVSAHQPRLTFLSPPGWITQISNPEVSQAFYGILSWQEDVYQITSESGFFLYLSIVVPEMIGNRTDFTVDIIEGSSATYTRLDGKRYIRTGFYEKFAGDNYLQWPTFEKEVGPGTYTIRITNPNNLWKYSLAIGKIESFPLNETIHTYKVLPTLKTVFFGKPRYMMFRNIVWWALIGAIIVIILLIRFIIRLIRYLSTRKTWL